MQTYTIHAFFLNEYEEHDSVYMTVFTDTEEEAKKMVSLYLKNLGYKNIHLIDIWNLNTKRSFFISNFAPRVFNDTFFEDLKKEDISTEKSEEDDTMG